jgi:hypothetical protein
MTDQEKLIKFAEHILGDKLDKFKGGIPSFDLRQWYILYDNKGRIISTRLPDYDSDLNVIAEIENGLMAPQAEKYFDLLYPLFDRCDSLRKRVYVRMFCCATAQQRRDALGRVFGLWEE